MRVKCRGFEGWLVRIGHTGTTESGMYYELKIDMGHGETVEINRVNAREIEVTNFADVNWESFGKTWK